jgi:hypothetical protein
MASLDQFKSLVSQKGGAARNNIFRVKMPSIPGASSSDVNLLCKDIVRPGKQILTTERRIGMQIQKVPYGYAVTDISMTFHVLNDYGIRKYFDTWQRLAIDQNGQSSGYLRGQSGYGKQIVIEQLRKGIGLPVYSTPLGIPTLPAEIQSRLPKLGPFDFAQGQLDLDFITSADVVYSCTLQDAFPTTMNDISLNNEQNGTVELNVQMSYTKWVANEAEATSNADRFVQTQIGTALGKILN